MTLLGTYLAQAPGLDFTQFGAFGVVLAILAGAVGILWKREISAHDRANERIKELEAALERRNTEDRENLSRAMAELAKAQGRRRSE